MSDDRKPWCAFLGTIACTCKRPRCMAAETRHITDATFTLLGYGLQPEEIVDDIAALTGERPPE